MFIDRRFRRERIFMIFIAPAMLLITALALVFLFLKKGQEEAADVARPPSLNAAPSSWAP